MPKTSGWGLPSVPYDDFDRYSPPGPEDFHQASLNVDIGAQLRLAALPRVFVGVQGGANASSSQIERTEDYREATDSDHSLYASQNNGPERRSRALLLGLQIIVGALLFTLGCLRVQDADDRLNRRVAGAIGYGVLTLLCIFGGLTLYAVGTGLLAYS
jgi:hypothetical protein